MSTATTTPAAPEAPPLIPPGTPPRSLPRRAAAAPSTGQAQAARATSRMSLTAGSRGLQDEPLLLLVYGVEGVGKSSFCMGAPRPKFLFANNGTAELDVDRFPCAETWQDILDAIDVLRTEPHDFKTLVVDELGAIEKVLWAHICVRDGKLNSEGKPDIEAYGFGKGYSAAMTEWRVFTDRLVKLRAERKMNIFMTVHALVKTFKNPDAEVGDYDRYQLKLHEQAGGWLKEWATTVLFAEFETVTKRVSSNPSEKRQVGITTGARVVHTQRTAAWDAKNRLGIPETIPLSWVTFDAAVTKGRDLRRRLAEVLRAANDTTRGEVNRYIEGEGYRVEAYEAAIAGLTNGEVK